MTIEEAKKEIEIYAHRESGLSSNQVVDVDHVFDTLEELQNDLLQNVRRSFITSFKDKNGTPIKEGDVIREVLSQKKESHHYEARFDMMGNFKPMRITDKEHDVDGWCIRQIKWSKDCLIAERLKDSGNVNTSGFDYLNLAFMDVNSSQDVEIIGNIHDGWDLLDYA